MNAVLLYPGTRRAAPPSLYTPALLYAPGNAAGTYAMQPRGCILHGTRSGQPYDVEQEFWGTLAYVQRGAAGLGWTVTIGNDKLAEHMPLERWGWNAYAASSVRLAAEFAQANVTDAITDSQVNTFCWWWVHRVLDRWPGMPLDLPTHAEIERWGETQTVSGKSDVFPYGSQEATELRVRIAERLASEYGIRA